MKLRLDPQAINPQIKARIAVPGDKSISHRAVMIGSLIQGKSHFSNFLVADDTLATADILRKLGATVQLNGTDLQVRGRGLANFSEPLHVLDTGNSGTTIRLCLGLVAPSSVLAIFSGDSSLNKRPMDRVINPLSQLGGVFAARGNNTFPPVVLLPSPQLQPAIVEGVVPSAQVKSAFLLAAVQIPGQSIYQELISTRNHTELMLEEAGAQLMLEQNQIAVTGGQPLTPLELRIPGDLSSAAYWIVAALVHPQAELHLIDVGINPRRIGLIQVLRQMGGEIHLTNRRFWGREAVADLIVKSSQLTGIAVPPSLVPDLIDEIPVLAVAAAYAQGVTTITNASELRVKESDRLAAITAEFTRLGVRVTQLADGLEIKGGAVVQGGEVQSNLDHRIAMSALILGVQATGPVLVAGAESINASYPQFTEVYRSVLGCNSIQELDS